jgi:geranylgeranyl pyrophosphate synthase
MLAERIPAFLPQPSGPAQRLLQALHYSTRGGKRVRPFITINAAVTFGLDAETVLPAAVAIEFIHAASLIHDDMPCIDDSPLRRGVPSCHEQFDQHTALLAGDALFIRAFELVAQLRSEVAGPQAILRVIAELGEAIGALGLIGGEAADIEAETQAPDPDTLSFIHTNKTAKLIITSARTGAILAAAPQDGLAAHRGAARQACRC